MDRLTDRPYMTIAVYRVRKTTTTQQRRIKMALGDSGNYHIDQSGPKSKALVVGYQPFVTFCNRFRRATSFEKLLYIKYNIGSNRHMASPMDDRNRIYIKKQECCFDNTFVSFNIVNNIVYDHQ